MADELNDNFDISMQKRPLELAQEDESDQPAPLPAKKPKLKKKNKGKSNRQVKMEADLDKKKQIGAMEPASIADFIASKIRQTNKDLTSLEIHDKSVPQASIVDTSGWDEKRSSANIVKFFKDLKVVEDGTLTIVLNLSAIRACDVCRALKTLKMPVGKLIPKNKPNVDKELLAKRPKLVTATPGRVKRLINEGILDPKTATKVVVEGAFTDVKALSVWDLPDTIDLLSLLAKHGAKIYVY